MLYCTSLYSVDLILIVLMYLQIFRDVFCVGLESSLFLLSVCKCAVLQKTLQDLKIFCFVRLR